MSADNDRPRIVIAVTESCSVHALWNEAMQHLSDPQAELVALYLADECWHRAASLPFTREVSRLSGAVADFTRRRADQLNREAADRARRRVEKLAAETELALVFRVLPESEPNQIRKLLGDGRIVLVAPSFLSSQPIYAQFEKLDWRIVLIETTEENHEQNV